MASQEARRRASAKWDRENMRSLSCKIRQEYAEEFITYCELHGMSPNTAIRNYVLECIGRKDEKMKEIYRSFEGKLSPENPEGHIIYAIGDDLLEIETASAVKGTVTTRIRVPQALLPESDYNNLERLGELAADCSNGCYKRGQIFFKGRWYSSEMISKIQQANRDNYWQKYVK